MAKVIERREAPTVREACRERWSASGKRGAAAFARAYYNNEETDVESALLDGYRAVQPPSMSRVWPVMSDAAGDARKITAPVTSAGSPMRLRPGDPPPGAARHSRGHGGG